MELLPAQLALSGKALYGERWQTDLARDLGLSDARRIRQWMAGERPIPQGIAKELIDLLASRKLLIDETLASLQNEQSGNESPRQVLRAKLQATNNQLDESGRQALAAALKTMSGK